MIPPKERQVILKMLHSSNLPVRLVFSYNFRLFCSWILNWLEILVHHNIAILREWVERPCHQESWRIYCDGIAHRSVPFISTKRENSWNRNIQSQVEWTVSRTTKYLLFHFFIYLKRFILIKETYLTILARIAKIVEMECNHRVIVVCTTAEIAEYVSKEMRTKYKLENILNQSKIWKESRVNAGAMNPFQLS